MSFEDRLNEIEIERQVKKQLQYEQNLKRLKAIAGDIVDEAECIKYFTRSALDIYYRRCKTVVFYYYSEKDYVFSSLATGNEYRTLDEALFDARKHYTRSLWEIVSDIVDSVWRFFKR